MLIIGAAWPNFKPEDRKNFVAGLKNEGRLKGYGCANDCHPCQSPQHPSGGDERFIELMKQAWQYRSGSITLNYRQAATMLNAFFPRI